MALKTGDKVIYTARNGSEYEATITAERVFDCTIVGPRVGLISSSYARLKKLSA